jgi:transposase-like protein
LSTGKTFSQEFLMIGPERIEMRIKEIVTSVAQRHSRAASHLLRAWRMAALQNSAYDLSETNI